MKSADVLPIVNKLRGKFPASLIMGIIDHESSFNESAFRMDRNGGSYGLMQVTMPVARDRGFKGEAAQLYEPATNIALGVAQLVWIKNYLAQRGAAGKQAMIAAYNEGVGAVIKGLPDTAYVGAVTLAAERWRLTLGEGVA